MSALLLAPHVRAQNGAFEYVDVSANVASHIATGSLADFWDSSPALGVTLSSPFYSGVVTLDASYAYATARSEDLTDFWTFFTGLGWGPTVDLNRWFSIQPSVVLGNTYMNFVDEEVDFRRRESEFFVGFRTTVSTEIARGLALGVSHSWTNTFTETPIRLSRVGVHARIRIGLPGTVAEALK